MKYVYDEESKQMLEVIGAVSREDVALAAQESAANLAEYDRVLAEATASDSAEEKPAEPEAPAAPAEPAVGTDSDVPTTPATPEEPAQPAESTPPVVPAPSTPPASETPAPAATAKDEFGDDETADTREFE